MFKREYYIIVFLSIIIATVTKSCRWMLYVRTDHQPRIKDSLQKENPTLIGKELGITN